MMTTAEAAALLTERGVLVYGRGQAPHPPTARTVTQWCRSEALTSTLVGTGTRALRLISREALDAFTPPAMGPKPNAAHTRHNSALAARWGDTMLNDAAKKLVARAARVAAKENRDRVALGANTDELAIEAWRTAQVHNPDFREWSSAQNYFDTIFYNEIERD